MNDPIVIARLDQLNTRLQQYLDAEAKILQSQEYVIGNGGTARRNRRADLEQVQAGITQVRADGNSWSSSTSYQDLAVEVTYTYGWASVPDLIKRAALLYAIRILAQGELPLGARDYSDTGPGPRFPYPGKRPHWTGDDEVDAILVEFEEDTVAIA